MNEIKYVIVTPPGFNKIMGARAIVFNGLITHADMVPPEFKIESAGFCYLSFSTGSLKIICHGESESLKVASDSVLDPIIIYRTLTGKHPVMGFIEE